jgi:hypothetical protein
MDREEFTPVFFKEEGDRMEAKSGEVKQGRERSFVSEISTLLSLSRGKGGRDVCLVSDEARKCEGSSPSNSRSSIFYYHIFMDDRLSFDNAGIVYLRLSLISFTHLSGLSTRFFSLIYPESLIRSHQILHLHLRVSSFLSEIDYRRLRSISHSSE